MQEDAKRIFGEILKVDPESYIFYLIDEHQYSSEASINKHRIYSCNFDYTHDKPFPPIQPHDYQRLTIYTTELDSSNYLHTDIIDMNIQNNIIIYDESEIMDTEIVETLPGTQEAAYNYKFTLYYKER